MQADEIRELSAGDIEARIRDLEEEQFRLRFRSATETLESPLRLRAIRKDIARLKTVLTEKKAGQGSRAKGVSTPASSPKKKAAKAAGR